MSHAMISGLNIFIISSQIYLTSLTLNINIKQHEMQKPLSLFPKVYNAMKKFKCFYLVLSVCLYKIRAAQLKINIRTILI